MRKREFKKGDHYILIIFVVSKEDWVIQKIMREIKEIEFSDEIVQNKDLNRVIIKHNNTINTLYESCNFNSLSNNSFEIPFSTIDQIILDYKYSKFTKEQINMIKNILLSKSCVPEEFQIISAQELFLKGEY